MAKRIMVGTGSTIVGERSGQDDCDVAIPSSVIHELRTPLTAIHGYAQVLHRALASDPSKSRATNVLLAESTRLAALLNQLSELASLSAGSVDRTIENIDVAGVARLVVGDRERRSPKHTLTVQGQASMRADRHSIEQLLGHVVDNAIAYSPDGGKITVQISQDAESVHIVVTDPGIGIVPEDTERIYQCYQRGLNAKRAGVRGLGLGLHIACSIAEREGGRIWHEPATPLGTTFHVLLPGR